MIHKRTTKTGHVRYDVRLRRPDGGVDNRTFNTRKAAESYERSERTNRDRGAWVDPRLARRTLTEIAAEWGSSTPGKRPTSVMADRTALGHILPALGSHRVRAVTRADIQRLVNDLSDGGLGPRSVKRVYSTLHAVLEHAVKSQYLALNPCKSIGLPKAEPTAVHIFTPDELATLADTMPPEYAPTVWLGSVLGLRWGEVAGLRVGALDLLGRTLRVELTVTKDLVGAPMLGAPKSNAGLRTLALPVALAELLSAHLAALRLTAAEPSALLFPAPGGGLLRSPNWSRRVWRPSVLRAGLGAMVKLDDGRSRYRGPHFHDLRRTSATALVVDGVDVKTAQYRLGHSSPVLTLAVYAQAVPQAERDAADVIGARLMSIADRPVHAATPDRASLA
jgi:integrase